MNRVAFRVLNFDIYYYSICILIGIIIAYIIITKESKKHNIDQNFILNLLFYGIIIGIVGARIYYVIFNMDYYLLNIMEVFAIRNGGLAIHGGVISVLIFIYFYSKKYNQDFIKLCDIVVPGVIIAQAIGRWGNFFNQEAYGSATTLNFLRSIFIPDFIINGMKINNLYYLPTFYFESIWCVLGFLLLIIIRKKKNIKVGYLTSIYFIWYGIGRFFIESFRTDSLIFLNLKVAQIVSIILIIIGILLFIYSNKKNRLYLEVK